MAELALPTLILKSVAATLETERPLLINRQPEPDETNVPITSTVAVELVDPGTAGIDLSATRVWINGALAFDGSAPQAAFAGPQAAVAQAADSLRIALDPVVPFASEATVVVHVVSNLVGGGFPFEQTYAFRVEDRTAPKLLAAIAVSQTVVRLGFDEPVVVDPSAVQLFALDLPAVPLTANSAKPVGTLVDLTVAPEMTPDVRYVLVATGTSDLKGNAILPPFDRVVFQGYRPPRHPRRRFDLWSMLPQHNRRSDTTGDLARFIACLQEVTDLLLADVDRFSDLWDLERAPSPFLDLILRDLGDPFQFDLDELSKRRLASVLVQMYQQTGTAVGIRNAVRFFLGIEVQAITGLAETSLVLGVSLLGVDWELGPSDRFARYAFDVVVGRVLTPSERKHLRALVNYVRPAHTHFVNLIEPTAPMVPDHWELGLSEVGETTALH